ncbi:porin family protein [Sinimarinibacterium sp. CAU 1509]|uniref:porin family protein n=1 Tax=Sinimarinibacterium sp. CAU 1509 TaxID=2562283 RepID=UPI0010AD6B97|nr:porin family protein [Sinimarinibacterium sp. CAU 1509]TJY60816.1 porin family protein [Sinimarinibacterium sp. CAU 1509]
MKARSLLAAVTMVTVSTAATADETFGKFDVYGAALTIDGRNTEDFDGIGGGLRYMAGLIEGTFLQLEAQYVPTDARGVDLDVTEYRAGFGYAAPIAAARSVVKLRAEYVGMTHQLDSSVLSLENHRDGYGIHFEYDQAIVEGLGAYMGAGYINVDDDDNLDGGEYLLGFDWTPGPAGIFTEYRYSNLNGDNHSRVNLREFKAGFRFSF